MEEAIAPYGRICVLDFWTSATFYNFVTSQQHSLKHSAKSSALADVQ